jgi:hypothetical protein
LDDWRKNPENYTADYDNLIPAVKETISEWISLRLWTGRKNGPKLSSYHLKHIMEREIGLYTTNGQFKGGMQEHCYEAFDKENINWSYKVRLAPNITCG